MIHRRENGMIALVASIRAFIALVVPFADGDAPGRAYTRFERSHLNDAKYFRRRGVVTSEQTKTEMRSE